MKKKRKNYMLTPTPSMYDISKKLLLFGALLLFGINGYGQILSIEDITEDEDVGNMVFTVTFNGNNEPLGTSVSYSFVDGTATGGTDYVNIVGPSLDFDGFDGETKTITVPITDDFVDEINNEDFTVQLGTPSNFVALLDGGNAVGTIVDNDTAGVIVSTTIGTTTEAGGSTTFTFTLTSEPTANVTIPINLYDATETSGAPSVVLTSANWNTGVDLVITGVDDDIIDGDVNDEINTGNVTSLDPFYDALVNADVPQLVVTNEDDDEAIATITSTDGTATEAGTTDNGEFTVDLGAINGTGSAIVVNFNRTGTATHLTDYATIGTSVSIANGQQTGTIIIDPVNDTTIEGTETVVLTLAAGTGYTVGAPNSASVDIVDNDVAIATITATDGTATEAGTTNNGEFTVDLGAINGTGSAIVVDYTIATGGSNATNTTDYATIGTSVSIANGQQTGIITIDPVDDSAVEGTETVVLTLAAGTGYTVGAPNSASVDIVDNDNYVATITSTDDTGTEAGTTNNGEFTVDLGAINGTGSAIVVDYTIATGGSNATNTTDYATIGTSVSIANGQQTGTIIIDPVNDTTIEGTETVVLTLVAGTGYTVGAPNSASVDIVDNDAAIATITATDGTATEAGTTNNGEFTVDLGAINGTGSAIVVDYTIATGGSNATNTTDYATIGTSVSIANGQQTGTIIIDPVDDSAVEGTETVVLTLAAGTGYTVGAPNSASVDIVDNDNYIATITATDDTATEAGTTNNGTFTVDLGAINGTGSAIVVDYTIATGGSNATNTTDYATIGTSVSIANGQQTGTVTINPVDDALVEGSETVILTLVTGTGYTVGSPNSATVNIISDDFSIISIDDPTPVNEGNTGTSTLDFTVSINASNPGSPITVNYTISGGNEDGDTGTLTFPTGTTNLSQTISVTTNGDNVVEADQAISVTLSNPSANATISPTDNVGTSSFTDDDSAGIVINDISVNEDDGTATFTITLNGNTFFGTTVSYQTNNNTAIAGQDYTSASSSVSFGSGNNQTITVSIPLIDDNSLESTETFFLDLTNSTSVFVPIIDNRGIATITDDDNCAPAPILNTDVQTAFCGTFTYGDGNSMSLNDYTDSTPPTGMVLTWSTLSDPLNTNAHLSPAEVNNITNDGSYFGFFYDGANSCASGTIEVELTLNPIPVIAQVMGDERCGPGEVILSASGAPDADQPPTFRWYVSETGGTNFATGQSITQNITSTTSYWVEAFANNCVSERQEVVATIYPLPSAGTPSNASACSIAANGPTLVDLDDLLTGEGSGAWAVTTDPSNSIAIGIGNIVSFEGRVAGNYVFTYTTDNATSPFCENVSSEVTIAVNDCDTDTDLDGLFDGLEVSLGTDPNNVDSDGDGIEDGVEVGDDTANPLDGDEDGIIDALDSNILDSDMDGVVNQLDPGNLNPCMPDPNNEFCEATVDLEILKTANLTYLRINEQLTFTITVNNISNEMATDIRVNEVLDPEGFAYVSHFISAGGGVYDEVVGTWDIPALDAGASVNLVILVDAIAAGNYENTATITAVSPFDIEPGNNEATVENIEVGERSNNECGFLFNQFSPNGDGTNDFLIINCIANPEYADNSLEIYDRYGNQVFATKGYDNTWAGTRNNTDVPKGTYFYILDLGDGSEIKKGWIQIIR